MGQYDKTANVSESRNSFREETGRYEANRILTDAIGDLSFCEKLKIWRRREGLSQKQAAEKLKVSKNSYYDLEKSNTSMTVQSPYIGSLYSHEMCYILRKRKSLTLKECAENIGISRYWCNQMELGKVSSGRLVQYWIKNER